MKILYVGHYKEGSGWSQAAIDLIECMDSIGINVVCRNIKLTNKNVNISSKISELEKKDLQNIDICIQHVLPHHLVGTEKFKKNIAYFFGESSTIKNCTWDNNLKLMDEIWLPNETLKECFLKDGFDINKLNKVPLPVDLQKYDTKNVKLINFTDNYNFKFYAIVDLNDRKNIESIIRSFHSEFESHEPVSLVLKVKKHGLSPEQLTQHVTNICNNIKTQLRIYNNIEKYHKEIIISEDLSSEVIQSLHLSCDCFINTTHGEGWSIPSFDAMCYGKTPICSNEGGPKEFIDVEDVNTGSLINGIMNICEHGDPAFPDIFSGREEWFVPEERKIKQTMRYYYANRNDIDRSSGLKRAEVFSYDKVGDTIKEILNV